MLLCRVHCRQSDANKSCTRRVCLSTPQISFTSTKLLTFPEFLLHLIDTLICFWTQILLTNSGSGRGFFFRSILERGDSLFYGKTPLGIHHRDYVTSVVRRLVIGPNASHVTYCDRKAYDAHDRVQLPVREVHMGQTLGRNVLILISVSCASISNYTLPREKS